MYFDTSYIAKFYFNEPESSRVREVVRNADAIYSSLSAWPSFMRCFTAEFGRIGAQMPTRMTWLLALPLILETGCGISYPSLKVCCEGQAH